MAYTDLSTFYNYKDLVTWQGQDNLAENDKLFYDVLFGGTNTTQITRSLGAVGTPGYSFIGDTNTGMYSSVADTLDFATNGVNRVSITTAAVVSTVVHSNALGSVTAPAYTFTGDLNTGIYSSGANVLDFTTDGVNRISIGATGVIVINEGGWDSDIRFEGDTNANLFFLDASADKVGFGTSTPVAFIQLGTVTAINQDTNSGYFEANASAAVTYIASQYAVRIHLDSAVGKITFSTAPSGTAGNAITYTAAVTVFNSGGVNVGAPTNGDKGSGTINTAGDIYKNDSAYTNPDYALEHYFTGKIDKFKGNEGASSYPGILPLSGLRNYMAEHFDLPGVKERFRDATGGQGAFARLDIALEKLEEAHIYIVQLHERIEALELKIAA